MSAWEGLNNPYAQQPQQAASQSSWDGLNNPYSNTQMSKSSNEDMSIPTKREMLEKLAEDTSPLEAATVATGKHMLDIVRGIKQLGLQAGEKVGLVKEGSSKKYEDEINEELRLYEPLQDAHPLATGIGGMVGDVAATLPLNGIKVPMAGMQALGKAPVIGNAIAKGAEYLGKNSTTRNVFDKRWIAGTNVVANAGGVDGRHVLPGDARGVYAGVEFRL